MEGSSSATPVAGRRLTFGLRLITVKEPFVFRDRISRLISLYGQLFLPMSLLLPMPRGAVSSLTEENSCFPSAVRIRNDFFLLIFETNVHACV